ncbi:MAG: sugar phosphate nucleotidyltransferase, partial [Pelagibacteraceae bacterium]
MKVKPVILCGGSGTRLFPNFKKNPSKQFIDFGGWTLFQKTLERVKSPIFDYPIISTNIEYKNLIINELKKQKIKNYKIILEPVKKNTAPAFISSTLIDDIKINQPIIFLPSDHYIPDKDKFNKVLQKNVSYLTAKNIFLFGIKPNSPRSDYGYLSVKNKNKNINKVIKFIEKPKKNKAVSIIKKGGLWNSGIVFARKDSIIYNSKLLQKKLFNHCLLSLNKVDQSKKI